MDEEVIKETPCDFLSGQQKPQNSSKPSNKSRLIFFVGSLGVMVLCVLISIFLQSGPSLNPYCQPKTNSFYSVVFDLGSTGSRMFVFNFKVKDKGEQNGPHVNLEEEVFYSIEEGISSFASRPKEAADSLVPLLDKAVEIVPRDIQEHTLVTVKATAGLRLLCREKGDGIMKEIQRLFESSPFYIPKIEKIMIMDGEEEGIFGWMTVNFLLDVLWDDDPDNSAAAIDLGGGSMQVTFEMLSMSVVNVDCFKINLLHSEFVVYTHSHLGYGLKSARLGILNQGFRQPVDAAQSTEESERNDEAVTLLTPCFYHTFNTTWKHYETVYLIKGTTHSLSRLSVCLEHIVAFVEQESMVQSQQVWHRELHLFSYFFDVAQWANIIHASDTHISMTPRDFLVAAAFHCDAENLRENQPFLCMDLLYCYSVLTHGFAIPQDKLMHVEKKIVGREVSWSLGAALATLSNDFSVTHLSPGME